MANTKEENPKQWSTKISPFFRIGYKEKLTFFKYLAVMTQAGIPLERSLVAIHNQTKSVVMHRVLHTMLNDVASGEFLSSSLKKMPNLFDPLFTNLVTVGETSGTLTDSLFRIAEHLEKTHELQSKVRGAFLYPAIVLMGTLGTTGYMLFVLLPQLLPLFTSLNVKLPLATRIVIAASDFLIGDGWMIVLGLVIFGVGGFFAMRVERIHYRVDDFLLRIPILGTLIRKVQVALLSSILATLLKSGTTIVESFTITSNSLKNRVYRKVLATIATSIQEGETVSRYLAKRPHLFPPFITQMVSVGEETGKLEESFEFISNFSEREVDDATKTLTTVLEPLLMIFIGAVVGLVAIAIITPIYSLTQGLSH